MADHKHMRALPPCSRPIPIFAGMLSIKHQRVKLDCNKLNPTNAVNRELPIHPPSCTEAGQPARCLHVTLSNAVQDVVHFWLSYPVVHVVPVPPCGHDVIAPHFG